MAATAIPPVRQDKGEGFARAPRLTEEFVVGDLTKDDYDIYTLLYHLNRKSSHDGVRDFLVHRLYRVDEEDIEAVLPQLCHLYMVWSPHRSASLGDFLCHLASTSVHFTLQAMWTFRASIAHCANPAQVESMKALVLNLEMALVNGEAGRMQRNTARARRQREQCSLPTMLSTTAAAEEQEWGDAHTTSYSSSRESSRESSPLRRTASGGSASSRPTSSTSRSRSATPKNGRSLPPPPCIITSASSSSFAAADSAPSSPAAAHSSNSSLSTSPHQGVVFRPSPDRSASNTPAIAEPEEPAATAVTAATGAGTVADTQGRGEHQTASMLANQPARELVGAQRAGAEGSDRNGVVPNSHLAEPPSVPANASSPFDAAAGPTAAASSSSDAPAATSASFSIPPSSSSPSPAADVAAPVDVGSPIPLSRSSSAFACSPAHATLLQELFTVCSKHVRSQYFSGCNKLMDRFGRVSSNLVKLPQPMRTKKLRAAMRDLDAQARGLYFPTRPSVVGGVPSSRHYRILRFLPDDTFVLNSRDKAPFLFHFEVQYTKSSVYDADLYTAYKSKDAILSEAIQMHHCERCVYFNQRKLSDVHSRSRKAQRIAANEATTLPAPPNPNPIPTIQAAQSQASSHADPNASSAEARTSQVALPPEAMQPPTAQGQTAQTPTQGQQLSLLTTQLTLEVDVAPSPSSSTSSTSSTASGARHAAPTPSPQASQQSQQPPLHPYHAQQQASQPAPLSARPAPSRLAHTSSMHELGARAGESGRVGRATASVAIATPPRSSTPTGNRSMQVPVPGVRSSTGGASVHRVGSLPAGLHISASAAACAAAPSPPSSVPHSRRTMTLTRTTSTIVSTSALHSSPSPIAAAASAAPSSVPRPVPLLNAFEQLSLQAFGESFSSRRRRIQSSSPFHRSLRHTDVLSLIFKHGDDVRQEVMAMQFITLFSRVFAQAGLPLYLHPYGVLICSENSGLIETIKDAISVDSLKKNVAASAGSGTPAGLGHGCTTLAHFFHYYFAMQGPEVHAQALQNFIQSMAAYSVVSYLLQIKDRHNGNLMLHQNGSLIHIDFGFILSNSPGGNMNFEAAPFKLTAEFIEVMGGESSEHYAYFQLLVIRGFLESRKHAGKFLCLLEILAQESRMACWAGLGIQGSLAALRDRFKLDWSEEQCVEHAYAIIEQSSHNWRTDWYDFYQQSTNGIS